MLIKYSAFILLILITSNVVVAEISHDFEIVFTEIRSLKKEIAQLLTIKNEFIKGIRSSEDV